jgi:hypothetical protein
MKTLRLILYLIHHVHHVRWHHRRANKPNGGIIGGMPGGIIGGRGGYDMCKTTNISSSSTIIFLSLYLSLENLFCFERIFLIFYILCSKKIKKNKNNRKIADPQYGSEFRFSGV